MGTLGVPMALQLKLEVDCMPVVRVETTFVEEVVEHRQEEVSHSQKAEKLVLLEVWFYSDCVVERASTRTLKPLTG